ncbi:hypothetical protein ACVGWA_18950, partial [Enterobacter hormaechei]
TRLRLVQPRADRERLSRPSRRYQEAGLSEKRSKMLTMWVTEDEHRRLVLRFLGKDDGGLYGAFMPALNAGTFRKLRYIYKNITLPTFS